MTFLISGGTIVDRSGQRQADLAVDPDSGLIVDIDTLDGTEYRLDAGGCLVAPGLVDLRAHLRQPGFEAAETIETAAQAAALGGYTAVIAMPDTDPCVDNGAVVSEVLALAKSAACEVVPAAAATIGRRGEALAPYGELADAGVTFFTDVDAHGTAPIIFRRALEYLASIGDAHPGPLVLAGGGEEPTLTAGGVMNEGEWSSRLGLPGRPSTAEDLAIGRDLALARLTGCRIHLSQVSTGDAVAQIRAAKDEGVAVTADTSPYHLVFDESACASYDPMTKLSPPLRNPADREALVEGLADGTIDAVATGHCPWPADTKERPFDQAPTGVVGLETTLALLLTELDLAPERLLGALSWRPAAIAGIDDRHGGSLDPGRPANVVVIDPAAAWSVDARRLASRSRNTMLDGRDLIGRVRHTIHFGRLTVVDGELAPNDSPGVAR